LERLRVFVGSWPANTTFTTRGLQTQAHLADLAGTAQAAEQLRAAGVLTVQAIGATRLWSCPARSRNGLPPESGTARPAAGVHAS
jgi:hypothetical protein